jgi:UDP-N-acetylmuramoyl-L-alanyl-D-glutamate--2,6-diaminopimelate ligase
MMTTLSDILQGLEIEQYTGPDPLSVQIGAIRFDSRQVQPGDLFVAVRGTHADGHAYLDKALRAGAAALVTENIPSSIQQGQAAIVRVADSAEALGNLASAFFNHPSEQFQLVGITGTNGKTTVATLLWQCFTQLGFRCGLVGTVENRIGAERLPSTHTTPDALQLQALFRQMADAGCTHVFMETSSHAIHQRRIAGARFAGAVFTNLTHDHLDYHGTFAAYRDAKKRLFDDLPTNAFALVNADDRNGRFMLQNTRARCYTFGLKSTADFKGRILENGLDGLQLRFENQEFHARMIGAFNASNLLAVYGVARLLEVESTALLQALSLLRGAEGRFDYTVQPQTGIIGIVDYAHTPDAVEQVLETIRQLKKHANRIITVIGCGGDRDKTKRPLMAKTAARLSDQLVLTSDNPRSEDPPSILADMEAGLDDEQLRKTLRVENREQAIKTAVRLANPGDIILVAGKGHEKYQEIQGVKHPFDDKAVLEKLLNG